MPKALPKRVVASRSGKCKQKLKNSSAIKKPTPVETRTARKEAGLLLLLLLFLVEVLLLLLFLVEVLLLLLLLLFFSSLLSLVLCRWCLLVAAVYCFC